VYEKMWEYSRRAWDRWAALFTPIPKGNLCIVFHVNHSETAGGSGELFGGLVELDVAKVDLRWGTRGFSAMKNWTKLASCAALSMGLLAPSSSGLWAADKIDFTKQIRPIFQERCYKCHGPDKQESGLRLDKRQEALAGGDTSPAIVPGDSTSGLLLRNVQSEDAEQVMPPQGDRLTDEQIGLLKKWIEDGAEWPEEE
jgi:mono/diheme cytochrome c family protein